MWVILEVTAMIAMSKKMVHLKATQGSLYFTQTWERVPPCTPFN